MRVGVCLPVNRFALENRLLLPETLRDAAEAIESAGFSSAWTFDALARGAAQPDPLTVLAVAGTVTHSIELGTGILQVPLRHHFELAQRVVTTQLFTNNRLVLGVGAGSTSTDFLAADQDFATRYSVLDRHLSSMRRLWQGLPVDGFRLPPWPTTSGGPPIVIGSWSGSVWIRRAAQEFDGWITSGARATWKDVADGAARFRQLGGGRALITNIRFDERDVDDSAGANDPVTLRATAGSIRRRLRRLRDMGFDDAIIVLDDAFTHARLRRVRDLCAI